MSIPEKFREALLQEFGGFYNECELPQSWDSWLREKLGSAAAIGALRMQHYVRGADILELVAYLRTESQNRRGELAIEIEFWTNYGWDRDEQRWNALQRILNALADQLESGPT